MSAVEPIAIVGIGCRLPGGVRNPADLWDLLAGGVDAITEVPADRWNLSALYHPDPAVPGRMSTRYGGFLDHIDRFDAQFFGISPREAAPADPQQRLLLEVAYEAVEDAGLTLAGLDGKRAGVYVGIAAFDYSSLQTNDRAGIDAYTNLGSALCIAANRISYFLNLSGPSLAVDTACSSSLVALDLACRGIWNGNIEMAFAGGVNVMLRPESSIGFSKASMLAPDGRCKTFDARANGYVRGEGAVVVILKPLARALADRDHIYALVRATAVNQDGRTEGISVPSRAAQEANLRAALRLADIAPESVQYVEAHGTGTPVGDPIEAAALGAVYGKAQNPGNGCVIGSIKSNVGHLEAASGVTGLIKTALCLRHRQIPASLHFEQPNPHIPFDALRLRVAQRLEPWPATNGQPPRAGVNSFGFGGTNAHVILEAAPDVAPAPRVQPEPAGRAFLVPLSARTESTLPDLARSYLRSLADGRGLQQAALRDICFSAALRRSHHEFRLTLVVRDKDELVDQLEAFVRGEARSNSATGRTSDAPPRPVFVCTGMGQQWWAMGRQLLAQEPVYRAAIEEVSDLFSRLAGWSLLAEMTADEKASRIAETHIGQPAIFAMQIALAALWRSWGIEPAAVLGHSAGEMAAACISGALSLQAAVAVTFHRSRLQYRTTGEGAMLAVGVSRAEAADLVARHPRAVSIAAVNGPRSITLSGDAAVLADIDKAMTDAGRFSRALRVEVPYHSPRMEPLESELIECLRGIRPRRASIPFFSTVTGTALEGPELDARYWYRNIRLPVLFHDAMGELIKAGHRIFLEIGAHPVLRHDIAECLKDKSVQGMTLASLRREEHEQAALLGSLGRLFCLSAQVDWRRIIPADAGPIKLPPYPFQAESHWRESGETRKLRLGAPVHPLLGKPVDGPRPTWQGDLNRADLSYLEDHRVAGSIVFPGAAYVEMALAAAREQFGSVPCVVEEMELQKFLDFDQTNVAHCARLVLDAASSDFDIHARARDSDNSWDLYVHGSVRQASRPPQEKLDLTRIRDRCPAPMDGDDYYRLFAARGIDYGPTFRGVARLWRGEREALADIRVPALLGERLSDYRFHPAVLDACLQVTLATLPASALKGANADIFVPVRIERVRFHAVPPQQLYSYARLRDWSPSELKADIAIVDQDGHHLLDVQGFICRPSGRRAGGTDNVLYEYQWKPAPRLATGAIRQSDHLPSLPSLAPVLRQACETLWPRFDRSRFQQEFRLRSRSTAIAYIVHALRELGWTPTCAASPIASLADRLGVAPQYHRLLELLLTELTAHDIASADDPQRLCRRLWEDFPECHVEVSMFRRCAEKLAAVLRGEVDPLSLIFPEGALTTAEQLYQDSLTFRCTNLLVQQTIREIVQRLPKGKALRILEVGGGTGGITSYILPVLPEHSTEYMFTDISLRFLARAQQKFTHYPFVQYRPLDIELDPTQQGFVAHAFDIVIASNVLHATRDLRKTLDSVKHVLASGGTLLLVEVTRPWLYATLTFGLLKGWWLFDDDVRQAEPFVSQDGWELLLREIGFRNTVAIADCPDVESAQHSIILAQGPQLAVSAAPQVSGKPRVWLLLIDGFTAGRASAGAELASQLRQRGDQVIEVSYGADYRQLDESTFSIRSWNPDDMRRLIDSVGKRVSRLTGIVHLWSLDIETSETMTWAELTAAARLGCVGVLQLLQTVAAAESVAVDGLWLVTRSAQPIANRAEALALMQSPLWGLGRVAMNEYPNLHCRLIDLATCSQEEIASLAEELDAADVAEDEIALHGELRYLHRLVPVATATAHAPDRRAAAAAKSFRIELQRPGFLDSLTARRFVRAKPKLHEVEIEVAATGINFKDLMLVMGLLPKDAIAEDPFAEILGFECAGSVVALGDAVSEFKIGDDVVCAGPGTFATHVAVDSRFVRRKPPHLSFEQAATVPVAFMTAFYALHTLGQLQRGERVLIHSGTGGVGLAAVQLALRAGAVVFASAGSPEKRELLSLLGVQHVLDSRSLAFADEVLDLTEGKGVDLVLNSLAGEAIDKSLSILRSYGRFVEIGKVDIYKNRRIGMRPLRKNISMFAVDLSGMLEQRPDLAHSLLHEVLALLERQELRPLPHLVFPVGRIADAFRHMAQAKHVGKLVVSMQDTEGLKIEQAVGAAAVDAGASYLITGGLGGLGLAVADRLTRHGARHLALVGRSAPSQPAQAAVEALRQRGVEVAIYQADVADRTEVERIITDVQRAMGPLRGIMHAAMVLDDAPIEGLTEERMWTAMAPKLAGAWNLHVLTAGIPLDFFVLFSSFASVLGSPGQANYVAGNAFLEALAHHRRARGFPALTVSWGRVGDTGHVASDQETSDRLTRLGILPIPAVEMLDLLDQLMSGDAVEVGAARIDWKQVSRAMGARVPGRFAGLSGATGAEDGRSTTNANVRAVLDADETTLAPALEAYLRDQLARAMGASPARIDMQRPLVSLGIDSLIAVDVRNRISADLGINLPLATFMQGASVGSLAAYVTERFREGERGKRREMAEERGASAA